MGRDTPPDHESSTEERGSGSDSTSSDDTSSRGSLATQTVRIDDSGSPEETQSNGPTDLFDTSQKSLKKNHPKNAIGYALAVAHECSTREVFEQYVIKSVRDARYDATTLGLIRPDEDGSVLTSEGSTVIDEIVAHHGGIEPALSEIDALTGSDERLVDACPVIGEQVRWLVLQHRSTNILIDTLDRLGGESSLAELAKAITRNHPRLGTRMFVSSRDEARELVFDDPEETQLDLSAFDDGRTYSTHTTFQYKATLYHLGILSDRGVDTLADLNPTTETWKLDRDIIA